MSGTEPASRLNVAVMFTFICWNTGTATPNASTPTISPIPSPYISSLPFFHHPPRSLFPYFPTVPHHLPSPTISLSLPFYLFFHSSTIPQDLSFPTSLPFPHHLPYPPTFTHSLPSHFHSPLLPSPPFFLPSNPYHLSLPTLCLSIYPFIYLSPSLSTRLSLHLGYLSIYSTP